ncbi:hypothetical protein FHW67_003767 [Herbaspirillum sp. Sphag1AN]|nr:hypothetical protein [Herbaspirillum sp. Sphag1AN]MBB3247446.1 hypothetical protein [Herbaspirillum sp. Sphag64]
MACCAVVPSHVPMAVWQHGEAHLILLPTRLMLCLVDSTAHSDSENQKVIRALRLNTHNSLLPGASGGR